MTDCARATMIVSSEHTALYPYRCPSVSIRGKTKSCEYFSNLWQGRV